MGGQARSRGTVLGDSEPRCVLLDRGYLHSCPEDSRKNEWGIHDLLLYVSPPVGDLFPLASPASATTILVGTALGTALQCSHRGSQTIAGDLGPTSPARTARR